MSPNESLQHFYTHMYNGVALFPGLSTIQVLITCSFCIQEVIKNWMVGRPVNEATMLVLVKDIDIAIG